MPQPPAVECSNHHAAASCTSSPNANIQPPKPNGPKTQQSHGNRSREYAGYLNYFQSRCIPVGRVYPVASAAAGIIMKQYDAVSDFIQTLVLDLDTSIWSVCHLTVFNGCVIM